MHQKKLLTLDKGNDPNLFLWLEMQLERFDSHSHPLACNQCLSSKHCPKSTFSCTVWEHFLVNAQNYIIIHHYHFYIPVPMLISEDDYILTTQGDNGD